MNYYDSQERQDVNYLNFFNSKTKLFKELTPLKKYSGIDVSGITKDSRTAHIELKERESAPLSAWTFGDIFIEPKKIKDFNESELDVKLYINIFSRGNEIAIWNMKNGSEGLKLHKNVKIWDRGARKYKYEDRYGLRPEDAIYYAFDNNTMKYVRKDHNIKQPSKGKNS